MAIENVLPVSPYRLLFLLFVLFLKYQCWKTFLTPIKEFLFENSHHGLMAQNKISSCCVPWQSMARFSSAGYSPFITIIWDWCSYCPDGIWRKAQSWRFNLSDPSLSLFFFFFSPKFKGDTNNAADIGRCWALLDQLGPFQSPSSSCKHKLLSVRETESSAKLCFALSYSVFHVWEGSKLDNSFCSLEGQQQFYYRTEQWQMPSSIRN